MRFRPSFLLIQFARSLNGGKQRDTKSMPFTRRVRGLGSRNTSRGSIRLTLNDYFAKICRTEPSNGFGSERAMRTQTAYRTDGFCFTAFVRDAFMRPTHHPIEAKSLFNMFIVCQTIVRCERWKIRFGFQSLVRMCERVFGLTQCVSYPNILCVFAVGVCGCVCASNAPHCEASGPLRTSPVLCGAKARIN